MSKKPDAVSGSMRPGKHGAGVQVCQHHVRAAEHDRPAAPCGDEPWPRPQRRAGEQKRQAGVELHDEVAGQHTIERRVAQRPRCEYQRTDGADQDAAPARRHAEAGAQLRHVGHENTVAARSLSQSAACWLVTYID